MVLDVKFIEDNFSQLNTILTCLVNLSDVPTFVKLFGQHFIKKILIINFQLFYFSFLCFVGTLGIGLKDGKCMKNQNPSDSCQFRPSNRQRFASFKISLDLVLFN